MNALWTIGKWLGGALAAAWAAWFVAGIAGDTGPMGWLNALQQDAFGSYSSKLSVLAGCMVFGVLVLPFAVDSVLNDAAKAVAAQSRPSIEQPAAVPAPWPWGVKALLWLGALGLVWAAAIAGVAWQAQVRDADARAAYPPFRLEGVTEGATPERMALAGRWLWGHTVRKSTGSDSGTADVFVPIVATSWKDGDRVRVVARMTPFEARQQSGGRGDAATVRVKVDGAIPTPAIAVFERLRAPLAADAVLVAVVPAPGMEARPPGIDRFDVAMWGGIGTLVVAFTGLGVFLMRRGETMRA